MKATLISAVAIVAALALPAPVPAASPQSHGKDELSTLIDRNLRAGGYWFTPEERALIEIKCSYAPGEWDGFETNLSDGTFICRGGHRVDDPEIRAVLRAAAPRIEARVRAVMGQADVAAAIAQVAEAEAARALRDLETRRP